MRQRPRRSRPPSSGRGPTAYLGGLHRDEAASALTMHLTKIATYGAGNLRTGTVWLYGAALTPATLLGASVGQKDRGSVIPAPLCCQQVLASGLT
jgi:uncharacterized protein